MGGCESCASTRRKEAAFALHESVNDSDLEKLKHAIEKAEACGLDSLPARKRYSELVREDTQSPEGLLEIFQWASTNQEGAVLYAVIQEVEERCPSHEGLPKARERLVQLQEDVIVRIQRFARNRNMRGLGVAIERARSMGVPASDLTWAEQQLRILETAAARNAGQKALELEHDAATSTSDFGPAKTTVGPGV